MPKKSVVKGASEFTLIVAVDITIVTGQYSFTNTCGKLLGTTLNKAAPLKTHVKIVIVASGGNHGDLVYVLRV